MLSFHVAHLASVLKVAVATAIVKTKPTNLTAEDYARDLCNKFAVSQLSWRSKYESVETELLHAKQELALREIHTQSTQDSQSEGRQTFDLYLPLFADFYTGKHQGQSSGFHFALSLFDQDKPMIICLSLDTHSAF